MVRIATRVDSSTHDNDDPTAHRLMDSIRPDGHVPPDGQSERRGDENARPMYAKFFDVVKDMRSFGARGLLTHLVRRALTIAPGGVAFRMILVVLSEPRPSPEAAAAATHHIFRFAVLDDLVRLAEARNANIFERDVASLQNGNRCLLQLDGDQLVGYTWISSSALIDLNWGFHVNLPDDMIYNYNGYTAPEYRGTAYQSLRHLKVLEHIRAEGKVRLLGYVDHLNYKSLRGVAKSGYERVGVLRGVRRKGKFRFWLTVNEGDWATVTRVGPLQR